MTPARHISGAFAQTGITERYGGVSAVKKPVDLLPLLKPCQRPVLPQDRRHIRERSLQPVMPCHQGPFAKVKPLVHNLPEPFHIPSGGTGHIHQIQGDNALIESAVKLGVIIFVMVYGKERTASHTGIAVAIL